MIGYFPKPYENELYYSIFARYHKHVGNYYISNTLTELVGEYYPINYEMPIGTDYLVSQVKQFSDLYSNEYFINNHTLIPFVKPFMKEEWEKSILNKNKSLRHLGLFFYFAKSRDRIEISKDHLYYCSECLKEQFDIYGEGYWNRIHQVPGVFVCTKHHSILNIFENHNLYDNEFVLPRKNDIKIPDEIYSNEVLDCLINLAEDVEYIINMNFDIKTNEYYLDKYKTLIEIKGIAYPVFEGYKKLNNLFLNFYPNEFLKIVDSFFESTANSSWLRYLYGKGMYVGKLHPIRHLLLMRLFCGSARNFFEREYTYVPFGNGPWVCMNPLAEHYQENVAEDIKIGIHSQNRRIQGDIICSCGFVYRLFEGEKSPLEIEHFNLRIIEKGDVWEEALNKLIKEKKSFKEIACYTKMHEKTVSKIIKNKNRKEKEVNEEIKIRKRNEKTEEYRNIWLSMRSNYPEYSRNQLNNLDRKVYTWLRKYDKEWIEQNSPATKVGRFTKAKAYSIEEDLKLLQKAEKLVLEWSEYEKSKKSLIRMSKYKLLNFLGLRDLYFKNSYPLSIKYVESKQELIQDFQKRRVRSLLDNQFENKKVTVAKVAAAAHLADKIKKGEKEIGTFIENEVELHNNNLHI